MLAWARGTIERLIDIDIFSFVEIAEEKILPFHLKCTGEK